MMCKPQHEESCKNNGDKQEAPASHIIALGNDPKAVLQQPEMAPFILSSLVHLSKYSNTTFITFAEITFFISILKFLFYLLLLPIMLIIICYHPTYPAKYKHFFCSNVACNATSTFLVLTRDGNKAIAPKNLGSHFVPPLLEHYQQIWEQKLLGKWVTPRLTFPRID